MNFCAEYSAMVPLLFENYYNFTGDKELLEEILPVAEGVLHHFSQFFNEDYLLEGIVHFPKVPQIP